MTRTYTIAVALVCGVAFAGPVTPVRGASYSVLYRFKSGLDGQGPSAGLTTLGDTLYGTTVSGGASGDGTVFSLNPATGAEQVVYPFRGGSDGEGPVASLACFGGLLFGTTEDGGANGDGTVFSIDPATGAESVVYSFGSVNTDGTDPIASLIGVGGLLYGTTLYGGAFGNGTVFSINPATGVENVVYSFQGDNDGANPYAGLVEVGTKLYGTTYNGGGSANCAGGLGCGTLFSLDLAAGTENVVYSFPGDGGGANPAANLINVNGSLYGTTYFGGSSGDAGTVFSLNPTTGVLSEIASISGGPLGGLVIVNGRLYGTSLAGGTSRNCGQYGCGTIFSLSPRTQAYKVVHSFKGDKDGSASYSGLTLLGARLYGTTAAGGAKNCSGGCGTVFEVTP